MANGPFEKWIQQLRLPWLGTNGLRIMGGFATVLGDKSVEWAERGNKEHLPEYASADALPLIGSGRRLKQGPTESDADYATRLTKAHDLWAMAGSHIGLLYAMHVDGFDGAVIVQQNGRACTLDTPIADDPRDSLLVSELGENPNMDDHPWWKFDEDTEFCSRFAVLFPDGQPSESLATAANLARLRLLVKNWKPGKATCVAFYVLTSGRMWGWPVANWGDPGLVWGGAVTSYPYQP